MPHLGYEHKKSRQSTMCPDNAESYMYSFLLVTYSFLVSPCEIGCKSTAFPRHRQIFVCLFLIFVAHITSHISYEAYMELKQTTVSKPSPSGDFCRRAKCMALAPERGLNWDATSFFRQLTERNLLAQSKNFKFCRVSGLEGNDYVHHPTVH